MDKDDFLGRWLADDISKEEKQEFENSKDYLAYKDILQGVEKFERPVFDIDKGFENQKEYNKAYRTILKSKVIKPRFWLYAAAAVVVILFGLRTVFFTTIEVRTEMAETKTWTLPEKSVVTLNSDSSIEYDKKSFTKNRIIYLNGEAFFDVEKGSNFTVKTKNGNVTVLGTEFNVYSRNKYIEVQCFEGKIQVRNTKETVVLTSGEAIKSNTEGSIDSKEVKGFRPSWMQGKSTFSQVTLQQLIQELERQYDIHITTNEVDVNRLFSGFFVHNDLENALKTCFEPMNISYTINTKKNISLKNK
ncbi:FecR family protein [Aquimarina sp. M1]